MLKVGLVGAGPWAQMFHGPLLAAAERIEFVGIWARRPEAAQELADTFGVATFATFDELVGAVDALAFCVPPDVQSELATRAALAGKHLLLEKPIAFDLASARALVDVIENAGVTSQVVLTSRYMPSTEEFIAAARATKPLGVSGIWVNAAFLPGGHFATPWRLQEGALLDVGPHAFDLLDAAIGPIVDVQAIGDPTKVLTVVATHEDGAQSTITFSMVVHPEASTTRIEVFGTEGKATFGGADQGEFALAVSNIANQFVDAVEAKTSHALDARRGLYLQELIEKASAQL